MGEDPEDKRDHGMSTNPALDFFPIDPPTLHPQTLPYILRPSRRRLEPSHHPTPPPQYCNCQYNSSALRCFVTIIMP